jgi:hypothetical protein
MMHRVLIVGVLLAAGCSSTNVRGPFARSPDRVDDPYYSIGEQERRGRERLSLPERSPDAGPPTFVNPPPGI